MSLVLFFQSAAQLIYLYVLFILQLYEIFEQHFLDHNWRTEYYISTEIIIIKSIVVMKSTKMVLGIAVIALGFPCKDEKK
jgi:hypothetical protein